MIGFWTAFAFVAGCAVGSFLNVCVFRMPRNCLSVHAPVFSFCPSCRRTIAFYDNIPVLSYLLLRGRCRHCGVRISPRYLVIEVLTGAVFALFFYRFGVLEGSPGRCAVYIGFACALIVATFIDFDLQIIPDEITLGGAVAGLLASVLVPALHDAGDARWTALGRSVTGALVGGGVTWLMGFFGKLIFRKDAMGFGDVKLMALVGSVLGWRLAVGAFFLAPFFGLAMGLARLAGSGRHDIPYGPFLSLAAVVALFFKPTVLAYIGTCEDIFRHRAEIFQAIAQAVSG